MTARVDRGRSYNATEDIIVKAHGLHLDGLSIREVARRLHHQTYYATPKAFANALADLFRARGWDVRPQSAATALSNVQRTFRPQCRHVHAAGRRAGDQCARRSIGDGGYCWHHDPDRVRERIAALREREAA